ncbi:hypothetical protein SUGI_0962680 [Cryptomeria japonica]|uniref:probable glycosyltransferase At3g42180 n=1 Tax=Cryptomeria japonica TaxID=3369 RepID=UPI002414C6F1|nr:probable glycosyltransferase At3g42180 [Cryptomeria japonica]GLJ45744.1 hypothetical protein SUGI_0962680 [Cryptomeria japonica]
MARERFCSPGELKHLFLFLLLVTIITILIYIVFEFKNPTVVLSNGDIFISSPLPRMNSHNTSLLENSLQSKPIKYNKTSQQHKSSEQLEGPYHNWGLFQADFQQMLRTFKIYVYPDIYNNNSSFAGIFLPHPNPYDRKLGNYFSEHMFKVGLLKSPFLTSNPREAHFFFLPFSINSLRNDRRVFSGAAIAQFVADYSKNISESFGFWNRSQGADHFYVCCHSVGRDVASKFVDLHRNVVQVVCSSSYFQRFYVSHKDVALPQVWPRLPETNLVPPSERTTLAFFAGRVQNSRIRQRLIELWENDTSMIISGKFHDSREGLTKSKYCLHVKGYEVNTARISDAIHFGCVPVIISDHYDLPFANVLDWSKFSIVISHNDVQHLKAILLSISEEMYASFLANLHLVRRHFNWNASPQDYDSFLMTVYQLWLRRGIPFPSFS